MSLWLCRAGKQGQYESKFLEDNRIYFTWESMVKNLDQWEEWDELISLFSECYPEAKPGRLRNWAAQASAFVRGMQEGDWVSLPSKMKPAIHFAEVVGPYEFNPNADAPYLHSRRVKWFATDIPRSNFDQDILYSLGAFLTVCQIKRNDAAQRIHAMAENDWKSPTTVPLPDKVPDASGDEGAETADLEEVSRDQIAKLIIARFKGHGMARLVDAILRADGYTTHVSPEGPDKGIDILAAPGALGFGSPRICVQVKSGDTPLDRPTLDQLVGTMSNVQAEHGLLVSWGGFKSSIPLCQCE